MTCKLITINQMYLNIYSSLLAFYRALSVYQVVNVWGVLLL